MSKMFIIISILWSMGIYSHNALAESDHELFTRTLESGVNYFKKTKKLENTIFPLRKYGEDFDDAIVALNDALNCEGTSCKNSLALFKYSTLLKSDVDSYIRDNSYLNVYSNLLRPALHLKKALIMTGGVRNKVFFDYFKDELVWGEIFFAYQMVISTTEHAEFFNAQLIKFAVLSDRLDELYLWINRRRNR